jgi:hypothetical protein
MKQYPNDGGDVMTLYAQGYSLSRFLVESTSRPQFLAFLHDGMRQGWEYAIQTHLRMNRVEDLEEAWLSWMRGAFRPRGDVLTKAEPEVSTRGATTSLAKGDPTSAAKTAPGIVARLGRPEVDVVRGASPDETTSRRPTADSRKPTDPAWSPAASDSPRRPIPVTLMPLQAEPPSQAQRALQYPPR